MKKLKSGISNLEVIVVIGMATMLIVYVAFKVAWAVWAVLKLILGANGVKGL